MRYSYIAISTNFLLLNYFLIVPFAIFCYKQYRVNFLCLLRGEIWNWKYWCRETLIVALILQQWIPEKTYYEYFWKSWCLIKLSKERERNRNRMKIEWVLDCPPSVTHENSVMSQQVKVWDRIMTRWPWEESELPRKRSSNWFC